MAVVGVGIDLVSIPDFAEQVDQPRPRRIHPRRHGETRQDQQRQQQEDDRDVAELLEDVVVARPLGIVEAKGEVSPCVVGEVLQRKLLPTDAQLALEVSVEQADEHEGQKREGEDERECQVPAPTHR